MNKPKSNVLCMLQFIKRIQSTPTEKWYFIQKGEHFRYIIARYHVVNEANQPKRASGE